MKRTVSLCITALLSCLLTCPALAADTLLLTPTLYPTEVNEYASGEEMRLERTYCLSPTDDPASIPVGDFDREGWHYTLLDVTRQENSKSDEKDYAETYTLNMDTKDMEKIMPQLAAERTVTTEDGYTGTLVLDTSSIKVEAAGYPRRGRYLLWCQCRKQKPFDLQPKEAAEPTRLCAGCIGQRQVLQHEGGYHLYCPLYQ